MMKNKIVIANLGNRNLKVNGQFLVNGFHSEQDSFREKTKRIWEKLQKGKFEEKLEPEIINQVIEQEKENIEKVLLFSSDMPSGLRNDQDTIFEGEILCNILKQEYQGIDFQNYPVNSSVFIHDELFHSYSQVLRKLRANNPDLQLIYCDAGGTSQQKFAMKIALEYLFLPDQFTVYYVAQEQKGKSKLMRGESYEYRKILDFEHAMQSIKSSSYKMAAGLLAKHHIKPGSFKGKLLSFLDNRLRLFFHAAENDAKQLTQTDKFEVPRFINHYLAKEPVGNYNGWENCIDRNDFFQLCEILIASQWKYLNNQIEQSVHFFAMFYENYLLMIIQKHFGYKVRKSYDYYINKLIADIQDGAFQLPKGVEPVKGIPLQIVFTGQLKEDNHLKLLGLLKRLNSVLSGTKTGIDKIRNDYAHKGKAITKEKFENKPFYNDFIACFNLMGIDFNRNYYGEMHQEVCMILRN